MSPDHVLNGGAETLELGLHGKASKKFAIYKGRTDSLIATSKALIQSESRDVSEIEHCLEQFERNFTTLSELADQIIELLVDTTDDQFSATQSDNVLSCLEEVSRQRRKLITHQQKLQAEEVSQAQSVSSVSFLHHSTSPRLPKLELPKFSGDPMKWNTFWDAFESSVHNNPTLSAVEKFNYLNSLLKGPAADATAPISVSNNNYQTAVDLVKERFGKKELIISSHVDALLKIPRATSIVSSLRKVHDLCEIHIGGLRALGIESEMYGVIVAPIILSKLPDEVKLVLTRNNRTAVWNLDDLRVLLREEVENREWVTDSQRISSSAAVEKNPRPQNLFSASLVSGVSSSQNCAFCDHNSHPSWKCTKFSSVENRLQRAKEQALCFNCFRSGHSSSNCSSRSTCRECHKRHHTSLCYARATDRRGATFTGSTKGNSRNGLSSPSKGNPAVSKCHSSTPTTTASAVAPHSTLILQTATATLENPINGRQCEVRFIFDQGSHRSFIRRNVVTTLDLKLDKQETISIGSFRSKRPQTEKFHTTKALVKCTDGKVQDLHAVIVPEVIVSLQRTQVSPELKHAFGDIKFADNYFAQDESVEVDVLIGVDHYWEFVTGEVIRSSHGLTAMESTIGWLLSGHQPVGSNCNEQCGVLLVGVNAHSQNQYLERLCRLDAIGIQDQDSSKGDVEEEVMENFNKSIEYSDNRYSVRFPWNGNEDNLLSNYDLSKRRLNSLIYRLQKLNQLDAYNSVILDQLERGFIEKVEQPEASQGVLHYIPHHPVIKPGHATTKLRIVYDCSAKRNKEAFSLNDCLHKGASLVDDLTAILLRFRCHNVALIADIEKAFLQVELKAEDRDATRFLWPTEVSSYRKGGPLSVFRFRRVLFGASASPFLLSATLKFHLEASTYPAAKKMLANFYVDNLLTGCGTVTEACNFYCEAKEVMQDAGMNLREWHSNSKEVLGHIPEPDIVKDIAIGVLGVKWDTQKDMLYCKNISVSKYLCKPSTTTSTKRIVLRLVASVFDPLGFLSPFTIQGKILMQELWMQNIGWDDPLQEPQLSRFQQYVNSFENLSDVQFPRKFKPDMKESELHVFVDASIKAYAAVAYLVAKPQTTEAFSTFVMSKTRVAPVKQLTLPKLELMAAYLGAKMASFIQKNTQVAKVHLWSDSQIVIAWIKSRKPLQPFVRNRVQKIKDLSYSCSYCPTSDNIADLPSRGCDIQTLASSDVWIQRPHWLSRPSLMPRALDEPLIYYEPLTAVPVSAPSIQYKPAPPFGIDVSLYSSYRRLIAVTAYCERFVKRLKRQPLATSMILTAEELSGAKERWEIHVQKVFFNDEPKHITEQLRKQLRIFKRENGLLRCQARIDRADTSYNAKNPKFLPKKSQFTFLLIQHIHSKLLHQGERHVVTSLRQEYWIPQIRQAVRTALKQCVVCKLWEGRPYKLPDAPPLPSFRVSENPPFSFTGCDFAGPLYYRTGKRESEKSYICIFTCAVTRAVHLELVHSLAAEDFLMCFRRFVSRRGTPIQVISDNAKTFVLSSKALEEAWRNVFQDKEVLSYVAEGGIKWRFNVPRAPWWGGFFERLVKSVKISLKKAIGRSASLSFVQIETLLTEIEAILNSRPLTFVYSEIDSGQSLKPSDFLTSGACSGLPPASESQQDPDYQEFDSSSAVLLKKLKRQKLALQSFWSIWRKEYLTSLQEFHRFCTPSAGSSPKIGDVVLLKDDIPRGQWKKAVIVKLFPGIDGSVRAATVKTAHNHYTRPINLLVPLEVNASTCFSTNLLSRPLASDSPDAVNPPIAERPSRRAAAVRALSKMKECIDDFHDDEQSPSGPGSM